MFSEDQLRNFDLFIAAVDLSAKRFPKSRRHCSVHAVSEGSKPLFCLVRAGIAAPCKAEILDYGDLQLHRESFSCKELGTRLTELNTSGKFKVGGQEMVFDLKNAYPRETFQHSRSPYHDWPGFLYEIGTSESSNMPYKPVVASGLKPYIEAREAIEDWVGVPVSGSDGRLRRMLLYLPRFHARIGKIHLADSKLTFDCTLNQRKVDVAVLSDGSGVSMRSSKHARKKNHFSLSPNPQSLRIFLVNRQDGILDSFAEEEQYSSGERVLHAGEEFPKELVRMIRGGETERVEFKEYIRQDDKKKAQDIIKTVIAFANTFGGHILFGVTDEAEIEGVDIHRPHELKKAQTFSNDYFTWIKNLLKQSLNRVPTLDMTEKKIGSKAVLVLHVREGSHKPYVNFQTRETYIRRGGNNLRPDPEIELKKMLATSSLDLLR